MAVVHPKARLHASVEVAAFAVIDSDVELGEGCQVGPHAHLTGCTVAGPRNVFGTGTVIGGPPQDLRFQGGPTRVVIGEGNVFREHVTVHCANRLDEDTCIGSHNLFMAGAHVGHNARIGSHVIVANGAQIAGHVHIEDRAFISGHCLIHQFVRVGALALMQGGAAISKDLPPYCVASENNRVSGLNVIGLRRAGVPSEARLELRRIYHLLLRQRASRSEAVAQAAAAATTEWSRAMVEFVRSSRRGVLIDHGTRHDVSAGA